ncbi:DUF302 domain-containing protein [Bordetella flabilis]
MRPSGSIRACRLALSGGLDTKFKLKAFTIGGLSYILSTKFIDQFDTPLTGPGAVQEGVVRWISQLLAIALTLGGLLVTEAAVAEQAMRVQSAYSFPETLSRLRTALEGKGLTIFTTIDHRAAAQSVGLDMPPTTVLIYGNPRGGTPLMVAAPDFALELPLRVLVREDGDGKTYVTLNPSKDLEGKHGLPAGMTEKLAPAEKIVFDAIKKPDAK